MSAPITNAPTTNAPILSIDNLECAYGPVQAIRGVSLCVPEGAVVTVLGANGAGARRR